MREIQNWEAFYFFLRERETDPLLNEFYVI